MASLLARLARPGRPAVGVGRSVPLLWSAAGAAAAVTLTGLAGLSLAVVVVQTLDPTGGQPVSGSIATAGRLWLLAQGGGLDLESGPLVLAPLLLTFGLAWCLSRAGRWVVRASGTSARDIPDAGSGAAAARALTVLAGVHTVLAVVLAVALDSPDAGVPVLRTTLGAAVVAVLAAGWGVGRESGALDAALDRLPGITRPVLRGAVAGLLTALALCTAVVAVAVAADAEGYAALSRSLGGAAAGALGLLGIELLLLPNAAAAVLGLAAGPGFVVGSGTIVSVHGVTLGAVPALPLLAALPDTQAVPLLAFVSQAVPALAGLVAGITVARWFSDRDGGSVVAALSGILAGIVLGALSCALVWAAGGSLGNGDLSVVGAPALSTGIAVAGQSGIAAAIAAGVTRWRARG
jgi:hypothetical protein